MNCIIGADKKSCKLLEEFAGKSSSLNLVGTFTDSVSVRDQLSKRQDIDLLFLDIEILGNGHVLILSVISTTNLIL